MVKKSKLKQGQSFDLKFIFYLPLLQLTNRLKTENLSAIALSGAGDLILFPEVDLDNLIRDSDWTTVVGLSGDKPVYSSASRQSTQLNLCCPKVRVLAHHSGFSGFRLGF